MNIELKNNNGCLYLEYRSKYATGSIPVNTPQDLIEAIEDVCGKGSFCLYHKPKEFPLGFPKGVNWEDKKKYNLPQITFWQQGVKTQVIEQTRDVAQKVWGDIPELKIGWLENMMKTYVD